MSFLGRWNGMLYFVPLVLIAVLRLAESRLDSVAGLADPSSTLIIGLSYVLVLSTIASIVDRAIAPRSVANPS